MTTVFSDYQDHEEYYVSIQLNPHYIQSEYEFIHWLIEHNYYDLISKVYKIHSHSRYLYLKCSTKEEASTIQERLEDYLSTLTKASRMFYIYPIE